MENFVIVMIGIATLIGTYHKHGPMNLYRGSGAKTHLPHFEGQVLYLDSSN